MNYGEQQAYLRSHALRTVLAAALLALFGVFDVLGNTQSGAVSRLTFICVLGATIYIVQYTPKYLYLTTDTEKKYRWSEKIRWTVCATAFGLGLFNVRTKWDLVTLASSIAWLTLASVIADKLRRSEFRKQTSIICFVADIILLGSLGAYGVSLMFLGVLAAISVLLALIPNASRIWLSIVFIGAGLSLLFGVIAIRRGTIDYYSIGLFLSSTIIFSLQLQIARRRFETNWQSAVSGLSDFTGRSPEEVSHLIKTAEDVLAQKWREAGLDESDKEGLRQWYKDVSFYYLFALAGFHQLYNHIAFTIDVLKMASGKCLDYGAGMGDLTLEMARRGHSTTYFDVDGESKAFAEWRAGQTGLKLNFVTNREQLQAEVAKSGKFNTIVSLDVLEHLPDIENELNFLTSILETGGKLIFSIPFGSTDAHPMHLDHNLDVIAYLASHGLKDKKSFWLRLISSEPLRDKGLLIYEKARAVESERLPVSQPAGV